MGGKVGDVRLLDRDESPVFLVFGSLLNPLMNEGLFLIIQLEEMIGRGHHVIGILGGDPFPDERFFRIARDDAGAIFSIGKGPFLGVQSQIGFP